MIRPERGSGKPLLAAIAVLILATILAGPSFGFDVTKHVLTRYLQDGYESLDNWEAVGHFLYFDELRLGGN